MSEDELEESPADRMRIEHEQYHSIVNHPVRKAILELLRKGSLPIEEIAAKTGLTSEVLSWHMAILESGVFSCVEKINKPEGAVYQLTKAGRVINYLE